MLVIHTEDGMAGKFTAEEHDRITQHDPAACGDCILEKHELYNGAGCWRQFCTCEFTEDQGDHSITRQPCPGRGHPGGNQKLDGGKTARIQENL